MNLPNKLTLFRIFLTAVFLWVLFAVFPGSKAVALLVFLLASLTDYWDGIIARARNQITVFGKLMDPIADKVLTISAFLGFVQLGLIPAWMAVVIIARDLLVTGLRFIIPLESNRVAARTSGKQKTAIQFVAIVAVLIFLTLDDLPVWNRAWTAPALRVIYWSVFFVVVITLVSGIRYLVANREFLTGQHPHEPKAS